MGVCPFLRKIRECTHLVSTPNRGTASSSRILPYMMGGGSLLEGTWGLACLVTVYYSSIGRAGLNSTP